MRLQLYIDTFPQLAVGEFVHESTQTIGDARVGSNCSIRSNAVLCGDVNLISIGESSNVPHTSAAMPDGAALEIGNHVTIAHAVRLKNSCLGKPA